MKYRVTELARKCEVNKETIRYYEKIGLLAEPLRTSSGYRIYSEETVLRLKFIKRIQELGFSLEEIKKLLGVVDNDEDRCKDMYLFVASKIHEIRKKISDLKKMENMLAELKDCCPDEKSLYDCPIIETLMDKNNVE